jgi:hypothetical protein
MRYIPLVLVFLLLLLPPGDANLDVVKLGGQDCGLEGKPGGSPAQKKLNSQKNRYAQPGADDIDPDVSLTAILAPGKDVNRFDAKKAATVRGFVVNVKPGGKESCNCDASAENDRDTHIELTLKEGTDATLPETQRVIVEVTPRMRMLKKMECVDWTTPALQQSIKGKWIEVTGWLTFDTAHITEAENTNPGHEGNWRATCWEIHPVTSIKILDGPPPEAADFQPASLAAMHKLHAAHIARSPKGKASLAAMHNEFLSKFSAEERKEAEDENKERRPRQP